MIKETQKKCDVEASDKVSPSKLRSTLEDPIRRAYFEERFAFDKETKQKARIADVEEARKKEKQEK